MISCDDRADRLMDRLLPLLNGCRYPLRTRQSREEEWTVLTDTDHDQLDTHLMDMDDPKTGEPLYSSLGRSASSSRPLTSAHQLGDREVSTLDHLLEDIDRGDMVLIFMDIDRKQGHTIGSYLSERAMLQGAFTFGLILKTGTFRDMGQIEDLNREILSLSRSFNGLIGISPRVTSEGRNIDLAHMIRHLTDMTFTPGVVNLDHADLMITSKGGSILIMTWGAARPGGNRAATSVKDALTRSLCDVDLGSVRKALVNVVGSGDLTLEDSLVASEVLKKRIKDNSHIIWGVRLDEGMEDDMEVFLILATTPMELLLHWYSRMDG